jgi:hypothetical protein
MSLPLILTIAAVVAILGLMQAAKLWLLVLAVAVCGLMFTHTLNLHLQIKMKNPTASQQT